MASVNDTVRNNLLVHPSFYKNRTEVLYHMLCVLGSGYRWDDQGEVVYWDEEKQPIWTAEQEWTRINETYGDDKEIIEILRPHILERIASGEQVVAEVDERMFAVGPIENDFYPQYKGALLMEIPDNVSDDWKVACEEMKVIAQQHGWVF